MEKKDGCEIFWGKGIIRIRTLVYWKHYSQNWLFKEILSNIKIGFQKSRSLISHIS